MKKFSRKIWNRIIESGIRGVVFGICFVIVLTVGVYFASANHDKSFNTQNINTIVRENPDNEPSNPANEIAQNTNSDTAILEVAESTVGPATLKPAVGKPKTTLVTLNTTSCDEGLKQKALAAEDVDYNAKVVTENANKKRLVDNLKIIKDENISAITQQMNLEISTLTRGQSPEVSALYAQKNTELARFPRDSMGHIISSEQVDQINSKYDALIQALNDGHSDTRKQVTDKSRQAVKVCYEQYYESCAEIEQKSKVALATLQSEHELNINTINNTCY